MVMACLGLGCGEGQGKESQHMQRGLRDAAGKGKKTKMGGTSLGCKWEGAEGQDAESPGMPEAWAFSPAWAVHNWGSSHIACSQMSSRPRPPHLPPSVAAAAVGLQTDIPGPCPLRCRTAGGAGRRTSTQ